MNGYLIISLENGLLLFTHTINHYGLSSSPPKEPLEISSYLYAMYILSKSYYDHNLTTTEIHDQDQDQEHGNDNQKKNESIFPMMMNDSLVTSFRESPISYFQQESIYWHFYESCGKDSELLTIVSSNCQIDHQYALLFAAKLSQTFINTTISDCVSPRSGIRKQIRENYQQLLDSRVKEIIFYLFDNLFVGSSSLGLVYVAEECSTMIDAYQLLESGKYVLESSQLSIIEMISERWNGSNQEPSPSPSSNANTNANANISSNSNEIPNQNEANDQDTDAMEASPPIRYIYSHSEINLTSPSPLPSSIDSPDRPNTAGDALRSTELATGEEESTGFLKSPIEWMRKRFTMKKKKSLRVATAPSNNVVYSQDSHGKEIQSSERNHRSTTDLNLAGHTSSSKLSSQLAIELSSNQQNTNWQLFHLNEQQTEERRTCGCPEMIHESSLPWLLQLIQTYQDHHLHLSSEDRISSMTTALPPFILSTSIPSPQTESDPSTDQCIHVMDISNSIYSSLSSKNLNIFLIWNESSTEIFQSQSPTSQRPSTDHNNINDGGGGGGGGEKSPQSTKDKIAEIFQTTSELKLLFLEFLELNLQLH